MTPNRYIVTVVLLLGLCAVVPVRAAADYESQRNHMVQLIEQDVRETQSYIGKKAFDPAVMRAIASVPRHAFVPVNYRDDAYDNRPLPIGYGQTISQPYIVALMTDLVSVQPGDKVLEIGTGSGYQAAVVAELTRDVYSIEIIKQLGERAATVLKQQGYTSVQTRISDGYYGWQEQAPFDVIIVTAAASHIPPPLVQQLDNGGRMVIPVGSRFLVQHLVLLEKDGEGNITTRQILPVRFVPLTGGH